MPRLRTRCDYRAPCGSSSAAAPRAARAHYVRLAWAKLGQNMAIRAPAAACRTFRAAEHQVAHAVQFPTVVKLIGWPRRGQLKELRADS